jgi:hypothetical protein
LVAAKPGRVDECECQPSVIDEDEGIAAEAAVRLGEYAVALGGFPQIRHQRQQTIGHGTGLRLHVSDIFVDMPDRGDTMALFEQAKRHCPPQSAQATGNDGNRVGHVVPSGTMRRLSTLLDQHPPAPALVQPGLAGNAWTEEAQGLCP